MATTDQIDAQEKDINSFNPNTSFTSYAVYTSGRGKLALYDKKGPASARMTNSWPARMSIMYECKNGSWIEVARTPRPDCAFCGTPVTPHYVSQQDVLIWGKPKYNSALICRDCRNAGHHHDQEAVDGIKHIRGL